MAYKAVIFDFGGVFTTSPLQNFAAFEKEHGLPEKFIGGVIKANHHENAWAQFERSEISLEKFDTLFAKESREAGYEITGATLVSLLRLELYPEMIDALTRVKSKGLKTGCITNNIPKFDNDAMIADAEKIGLVKKTLALFDHVIESSKAGVRKPEPRIYEMMCEALNTPPQDCIFLDDLGINLKPAKAMGMATIKVPIGDVRPAIKELENLIL
ncbi:MAG: phosphoglycolate phosphatase [Hyphococcus sp.]|nr:MAG: phosphoglycolate phosphatase [Marinicaulis sp.]